MKPIMKLCSDYKIFATKILVVLFCLAISATVQAQSSDYYCRAICNLAWSPVEQNLLAIVNRYGLWLYDASDPSSEPHLFPLQNANSLSFDPTGTIIAVTSCPESYGNVCKGRLSLFRLDTRSWKTLAQYDYPIENVKFSPNGQYVAFEKTRARGVQLLDLVTHNTIFLTETNYTIYMLDYSFDPQSSRIAIASGTPALSPHAFNGISVWRLSDQTLVAETPFGILAPTLTFSADGRAVIYTQYNTKLLAWDIESGAISTLRQLTQADSYNLNVLRFSHDSRYLIASLLSYGSLFAWEVESGAEVVALDTSHRSILDAIAINPAGTYFAFGGSFERMGMTVTIWEQAADEVYRLSLVP